MKTPTAACSALRGFRVYFTEMCSGSEAGWHLRLIHFVYHPTLGLRDIKRREVGPSEKSAFGWRGRWHGTGRCVLQGYLAHKKLPPPQGRRRPIGIVLL